MAVYRVNLKDKSGNLVAVFDSWMTLGFTRKINTIGSFSMTIDGDYPAISLFETDGQIEVWRSDTPNGIDWYIEWEGFYRGKTKQTNDSGLRLFTAEGYTYNHLLSRRIIAYREGTTQAKKVDAAETAMKEYVLENAGALAINPPRLGAGAFPGLTVAVSESYGGLWEGSKEFANLFDVCAEIAKANLVDFDIVGTGKAAFEFRARYPYWGKDRTYTNVNKNTGKNVFGNAPVVFRPTDNTMSNIEYKLDRSAEINRVYVLGAGELQNQLINVVDNTGAIVISSWNQCEGAVSATDETSTSALDAIGLFALYDLKAQETIDFNIMQQPGLLYGRDYFMGDLITAIYDEESFIKKISTLEITVDAQNQESIKIGFEDAT